MWIHYHVHSDVHVHVQVVCRLVDFIDDVVIAGESAMAGGARPTTVSPTVPVTAFATRGYLAQHRLFEQERVPPAHRKHPATHS